MVQLNTMEEFPFTNEQLKEMGWDGNPSSLDDFKAKVKLMLMFGWNPKEISMPEFEVELDKRIRKEIAEKEASTKQDRNDTKDDYEQRRHRASLLGWDEEEMDLEEFEDYYE